jgi:hypothetical protein
MFWTVSRHSSTLPPVDAKSLTLLDYPDRFKDVQGHGQERSIYQVYDEELMRAAAAREREVVEKRLRDAAEEAQAKAEEMLTLVFSTVRKKEFKKSQQEAKDKLPQRGRGVSLKPPPMM